MTDLVTPLLTWARFHQMRWLQHRAHRSMLRSICLDRAAADAWQRERHRLGLAMPMASWRPPSVPAATKSRSG
jgi:hypothetical protein